MMLGFSLGLNSPRRGGDGGVVDPGATELAEVPFTIPMAASVWYTARVPASYRKSDASQAIATEAVDSWQDQIGTNHALSAATGNGASTATTRGVVGASETLGSFTGSPLRIGNGVLTHRYNTPTGLFASVTGQAGDRIVIFARIRPPASAANRTMIGHSASNFYSHLLISDSTVQGRVTTGSTAGIVKTDTATRLEMLVVEKTGTASNVIVGRLNGSETVGANGVGASIASSGRLTIGNAYGGNQGADADIFEFMVVPAATATRENIQRIEGELAHYYGQTALLPADHPWKNAAPKVPTGTTSVASYRDANLASPQQTFLGFDVELQGLAYEYPTTTGSGSVSDTQVGGLLYELTSSERTRFAQEIIGYGNGFRALRWSGGLHQHRARTADTKELQQMYVTSGATGTQVTASVSEDDLLLDMIADTGKDIEVWYEEWGCGEFWRGGAGQFNRASSLTFPDPVADAAGYAAWITGFATAYFNNMVRLDVAGFKITRVRGFNEIGNTANGWYPHIIFQTANDAEVVADFLEELVPLVRGRTWLNTVAADIKFGVESYKGSLGGFSITQVKASTVYADIVEWNDHRISDYASDGEKVVAVSSADHAGRPTNINEHEFFDAVRDALLLSSGTLTAVSGVTGNVVGQGADAENYMFANIGLVFLKNVTLNAAVTHQLMIHAGKPSYDGDDNLGYVLTNWRSTLDGTNNSGYAGFDGLAVGHWDYYPTNWNAVAGFLKYLPWDSVRLSLTNWKPATGQAIAAFETPAGKVVYIAVNRSASTFPFLATVGVNADGSAKTFKHHRFTQSARDTLLGTYLGQVVSATVAAWAIEFWVEQ